ncbi:MAG: peptidase S24 [Tannerella sp.]|nr:peptidase S24 [Tannerella sp.]
MDKPREISTDKYANILDYIPDVNPEWLLTGKGEMLLRETKSTKSLHTHHIPDVSQRTNIEDKDKNPTSQEKTQKKTDKVSKLPADSAGGIPLIPINAMAGYLTGETQVLEYECERYIVPLFHDAEFLMPIKGSSMIPKYNSGDLVACKKLPHNDLFFQWNKVYVIDTAQGPLIKRVKKSPDDDHIIVVSDNKEYDSFTLHKSQIYAVALVIGVIRLE